MFAEIRKDYLNVDRPCPLAMAICNIGASENQVTINRPEGFQFHHALWVTKGEGSFEVNGQRRVLRMGEGLFCRKNVPHAYERSGEQFSTRWLTFLGGEGALDYYGAADHFYFSVGPALSASTDSLERICQSSGSILSRSVAGYSWLVEWLDSVFAPSVSPAAVIRQYLEIHFAEPLTLETIGNQVHMDRYALCRYYRQEQGISVMEQLKRIRIAKAKQFLRYASCSIEEVGVLCGYMSPSYFGKIFREETGLSPREYREKHMK